MRRQTLLRWSGYLAVAIAFAIACAFLSHWQFSRNEQRAAAISLVERNYDAAVVPLDELIPAGGSFDPADEWRPVLLRGTYLVDQQVLVRNRPRGGSSAFEVLVPLRLDDGRIFLVDRGWVAAGDRSEPEAIPASPTGSVEVVVRLRPEEAAPTSGRSAEPGQVPTITITLVEAQTSLSLIPGTYGLLVSEQPSVPAPASIDPPTEDPGPHLSYAIQWILFAVMGFVFIGYMIHTERKHRREDALAAAEGRAPVHVSRPRRKDVDADAEDEILSGGR